MLPTMARLTKAQLILAPRTLARLTRGPRIRAQLTHAPLMFPASLYLLAFLHGKASVFLNIMC